MPLSWQRLSWITPANCIWLGLYLLTMSAVVYGLYAARENALETMTSAEAQAHWEEFRSDMVEQSKEATGPVKRRPPKITEPPTLKLLRDYFGVCVMIAVMLSSALFATLMIMVRGVFRGEPFVPVTDR